ncbi:MAG: MerR family transcriptional regulator [Meiothermus sp.]|uniref:MerR family transcriptional regulator n=1 Tax=Meiothermus sp. TaxID=1955249 RepID=UPI0025CF2124|nr:MerR family transcriptional regulator [Meiothermus sp.]MCS7195359.1 MerR family transcriptional regulator [Meiothermus sp.]MDW8092025.1 MerR family transcriptional regulator [Meiothermus sp.]
MPDLAYLLEPHRTWGLEELVEEANRLLPQVLPEAGRGKEAVSGRTVRYYTSEGLLDPPARDWREARYSGRHLLQLLLARKLLAQGHTLRTLAPELRKRSTEELLALLQQPTQVVLRPANPALEYLERLAAAAPRPRPAGPEPFWRVRVREGLEVWLAEDYPLPQSPAEWQALLEEIGRALQSVSKRPGGRP